ncbi:MAG: hypothetical protein HY720_29095 [Planctomycetes bacterium]|nr:hypothetical protein [Planctomycetota bacterium]
MHRRPISTALLFVLLLAAAASAQEKSYPTYEQIARAPSAYSQEVSLSFTMRFQGLKDPDPSFAAVGRNGSTHVELVTVKVRGTKERLPIFLAKSSSYYLKKLRQEPTGVTGYFRGRMRYFKTDYYPPQPGDDKGKLVNVDMDVQQSIDFSNYFLSSVDKSQTGPTNETPERKPQGQVNHYLVDLFEFRELQPSEKPAEEPEEPDRPEPAAGYREVRVPELARGGGELAGTPIRFPMTYGGRLGHLVEQEGASELVDGFRLPEKSCVRETDLPAAAGDPTAGLEVIAPPGPLGKLVAIAFGTDWDVARDLAGLSTGDRIVVHGVLYRGSSGARFLFVLEGIEEDGDGPRGRDR